MLLAAVHPSRRCHALLWALNDVDVRVRDQMLYPVLVNRRAGFIDQAGSMVIKPRFEFSWGFSEGLAAVQLNGKWGFIDREGSMVIPNRFDDALWFSSGRAAAKVNGKWGLLDRTGHLLHPPRFDTPPRFSEGLAAVRVSGRYGYINEHGEWAVRPLFAGRFPDECAAHSFREGLALVQENGLWGFINKQGSFVVVPSLECANCFSESVANVGPVGDSYFIDKMGRPLFGSRRFRECNSFSEGFAAVRTRDLWGFINEDGKHVIGERYVSAFEFGEGLAAVGFQDGTLGYINRGCELIIRSRNWDFADRFRFGIAAVSVENRWGYIDRTGKYLWRPTA